MSSKENKDETYLMLGYFIVLLIVIIYFMNRPEKTVIQPIYVSTTKPNCDYFDPSNKPIKNSQFNTLKSDSLETTSTLVQVNNLQKNVDRFIGSEQVPVSEIDQVQGFDVHKHNKRKSVNLVYEQLKNSHFEEFDNSVSSNTKPLNASKPSLRIRSTPLDSEP